MTKQVTIRLQIADKAALNTPHSIEKSLREGHVVLLRGADKCVHLFHNCWQFVFSDISKERIIQVHFKGLDKVHEKIFLDKDLHEKRCGCALGRSIVKISEFSTFQKCQRM